MPLFPLRHALMEWFRAAELSCDRAAALVIRDPVAVCRTLMVITAGAEAANLDLDVFMKQGQDYREKASPFDRLARLRSDLNLTHPMSVQRVHELMAWVKSGEYDRIVGGAYLSREEPQSPRGRGGDAVAHYAERSATPSRSSESRSRTPASSSASGCARRVTSTTRPRRRST